MPLEQGNPNSKASDIAVSDDSDPISLLDRLKDEIDPDLVAVAAGDREPSPEEAQKLDALRQTRGPCFYSDLLLRVTNEYYPYNEAQELWEATLAHKKALSELLGRNVGISVAALDYLSNVRKELSGVEIISEPKLRAITSIAIQDPVTGLLGRAVFESRLRNEMQRHERYGNRVSLLMLDLDDFKRLNDTLGHRRGDSVLEHVGQIIKSEVRDVDIACRYGGEELAVILPQTDLQEALLIGERIRSRVEQDLQDPGVTLSAGVASCPEHASSVEALIEAADQALYQAKHAGKNCVVPAVVKPVLLDSADSDRQPDDLQEARRAHVARTNATYPAETAA